MSHVFIYVQTHIVQDIGHLHDPSVHLVCRRIGLPHARIHYTGIGGLPRQVQDCEINSSQGTINRLFHALSPLK